MAVAWCVRRTIRTFIWQAFNRWLSLPLRIWRRSYRRSCQREYMGRTGIVFPRWAETRQNTHYISLWVQCSPSSKIVPANSTNQSLWAGPSTCEIEIVISTCISTPNYFTPKFTFYKEDTVDFSSIIKSDVNRKVMSPCKMSDIKLHVPVKCGISGKPASSQERRVSLTELLPLVIVLLHLVLEPWTGKTTMRLWIQRMTPLKGSRVELQRRI